MSSIEYFYINEVFARLSFEIKLTSSVSSSHLSLHSDKTPPITPLRNTPLAANMVNTRNNAKSWSMGSFFSTFVSPCQNVLQTLNSGVI